MIGLYFSLIVFKVKLHQIETDEMKLFINDIPVKIRRMDKEYHKENFTIVIDGRTETDLSPIKLAGDVLVWDADKDHIEKIFTKMKDKKLKKLKSITFAVDDKESAVHFVKDQFTVIKAAGGVVVRNGKILFIYRLKKWDLPKGKLDKKESPAEGALREVEEECNIKVKLDKKVCATWHTYNLNGKRILKKTTWYKMKCLDDSKMKPQKEEDIEDIKWLNKKEIKNALSNSYKSIEEVIKKYYEMIDVKSEEVKIKSISGK
jgi:8-oxo-(d)GTP phosphatase